MATPLSNSDSASTSTAPPPVGECAAPKIAFANAVPAGTASKTGLDDAAIVELHEWLNRLQFKLFGTLRDQDREDAVEETFLQTLVFLPKLRDLGAVRGACLTIGARIRARRIGQYAQETTGRRPIEPIVGWNPERHLYERSRRLRAFGAIRLLRSEDQEILERFYFDEQRPEQICDEMQLTTTQFRLRKTRAIRKAALRMPMQILASPPSPLNPPPPNNPT